MAKKEKYSDDFEDDLQPKRNRKGKTESQTFFYLLPVTWSQVWQDSGLCCAVVEIKYHVVCDFVTLSAVLRFGIFLETHKRRKSQQANCLPPPNTRGLSIFCDKLFTHIKAVNSFPLQDIRGQQPGYEGCMAIAIFTLQPLAGQQSKYFLPSIFHNFINTRQLNWAKFGDHLSAGMVIGTS